VSLKARLLLIRPLNIALLALGQLACFSLFVPRDATQLLFLLLVVLSTTLTAAAGYTVNDLFDRASDRVSKPKRPLVSGAISVTNAWVFYFTLLASAFLCAFFASNTTLIFVVSLCNAALFLYAAFLKRTPLMGNILVSSMAYLSFALGNLWPHPHASFVSGFAFLAFSVTLYRELLKTNEDFEGDKQAGFKTLPVRIGLPLAEKIAFLFGILCGLFLIFSGLQFVPFVPIPQGFTAYSNALILCGTGFLFQTFGYHFKPSFSKRIPASFWPKIAIFLVLMALLNCPVLP
jgi:4-hydroxybenzoate polyprenyltransferase